MSYNFTQQPSTKIFSANNPAVFVVSSSNANQTDQKYRADIYLNGVFTTTMKTFPNPDNSYYGVFDLSDITSYLTGYDYIHSGSIGATEIESSGFAQSNNSWFNITALFGEEYISANGNFSQSLSLVTSSTMTFINSSLSYPDQINLNLNDYYLDNGTQRKCLTRKADNTFKSYSNLHQWLYYFNSSGSSIGANVYTYDVNGNNLGIYSISNPYAGSSGIQIFGSGYPELSALPTSSYSALAGTYPIITSNVHYYIINFGASNTFVIPVVDFDDSFVVDFDGSSIVETNSTSSSEPSFLTDFDSAFFIDADGSDILTTPFVSGSTPITVNYQYNISPNCGKYAPGSIALEWFNTLGGVDSFLFTLLNETTETKSTSQYQKVAGTLNSNGTYSFDSYTHQKVNYYTDLTDSHDLNTDWLDDTTILYLKDLVSSPLVWMRLPSGNVYSVNVKDDSFRISKKVNQKLYQLKLTVENTFSSFRQKL